jgi:2-keto-3-deoxy-L-rhamnonate aldolase RhmA
VALEHSRPDLFRSPDVPVGLFVLELFSPNLWHLFDAGGLDFAVVDLEHSRLTTQEISILAASAHGRSIPLLVRLPQLDRAEVSKMLDLGVTGLIVSRIETAEEAERLVSWMKFPPRGTRGAAFGVAYDGFGGRDWQSTAEWANERTLCVPLIETVEGVRNAHEICAVPDLDAVWVGPADLSQSLGRVGDVTSPEYMAAEDDVLAAAAEHGIPVGVWVRDDEELRRQLGRGFGAVAVGTDTGLLLAALRDRVARVRELASAVRSPAGGSIRP